MLLRLLQVILQRTAQARVGRRSRDLRQRFDELRLLHAREGSGGAATRRYGLAAYNRDVAKIRLLGIAVERERLRLNRALG